MVDEFDRNEILVSMHDTVRVLHVDDDSGFAELVESTLTREGDFEVELESDPEAALERVRRDANGPRNREGPDPIDCIVSDYEMPGMDGIELLREVREVNDRLPFILFTSRGSEEVASEAISAGVTDYIQKQMHAEQYELLAKRIRNATDHYRTERALRESEELYRTVVERSHSAIFIYQDETLRFVNERACRLTERDESELVGTSVWSLLHPEDRERVREIATRREETEERATSQYRARVVTADGDARLCSFSVQSITYEGRPAVLGSAREVSDEQRATERFQAFIEHSSDLVTVLGEDGVIEYGSPSVEQILGWRQENVAGNDVFDFVHPDDVARVRAILDRLASQKDESVSRERDSEEDGRGGGESERGDADGRGDETQTAQFRVRHANGSWVWLESVGHVQPLDSIDGFVINSRDVTARHEREQQLRRYESVVDNIQQGTYVVGQNRRFEFVNDAVIRRTALTREDIVGRPLSSLSEFGLIDDRAMDRLSAAVDRILDGESEAERVELDVDVRASVEVIEMNLTPLRENGAKANRPTADGRIEAADERSVTGVVAISTDVTRRRQYQKRLESLHEASRELTRATTYEAVATIVSDAATDILNYPLNGVFFREDDALVPYATTGDAQETFDGEPIIPYGEGIAWRVLETGNGEVFEDVAEHPDRFNPDTPIRSEIILPIGEEGVLMAGSTEPGVFDDSRTSLAHILVSNARAALERVDREQLLRRRERELERQNEQLERVANVVSHDLRNPLNVAHGQVELLERAYERGEESDVYRRIEQLRTAHDRMRRIVDDMLNLARHGRPVEEMSRFPLRSIVASAWRTTEYDRGKLIVTEDLGSVQAHDGRLKQLFENLFRNAMEHNEGTETKVTVGLLDDANGFYVADDGTGIPPENRDSVFEPGMSTHESGTGLGLGIVETIANGHGWAVSVTESEDGGARFEIRTEPAATDCSVDAPR